MAKNKKSSGKTKESPKPPRPETGKGVPGWTLMYVNHYPVTNPVLGYGDVVRAIRWLSECKDDCFTLDHGDFGYIQAATMPNGKFILEVRIDHEPDKDNGKFVYSRLKTEKPDPKRTSRSTKAEVWFTLKDECVSLDDLHEFFAWYWHTPPEQRVLPKHRKWRDMRPVLKAAAAEEKRKAQEQRNKEIQQNLKRTVKKITPAMKAAGCKPTKEGLLPQRFANHHLRVFPDCGTYLFDWNGHGTSLDHLPLKDTGLIRRFGIWAKKTDDASYEWFYGKKKPSQNIQDKLHAEGLALCRELALKFSPKRVKTLRLDTPLGAKVTFTVTGPNKG